MWNIIILKDHIYLQGEKTAIRDKYQITPTIKKNTNFKYKRYFYKSTRVKKHFIYKSLISCSL